MYSFILKWALLFSKTAYYCGYCLMLFCWSLVMFYFTFIEVFFYFVHLMYHYFSVIFILALKKFKHQKNFFYFSFMNKFIQIAESSHLP